MVMFEMDKRTPQHEEEHKILVALRRTLGAIVRDTTPQPGMRHPLTEKTIQDIRACFALIAARERDLIEQAQGEENRSRPRYADAEREAQTEQPIVFQKKSESERGDS